MRDESMVIAGRLTGKWKFNCFVCRTEHKQQNTIEHCAEEFAYKLMLGKVVLGSETLFALPNRYEVAKKGLLDEYGQIVSAGDRIKKEIFALNVDRFALAENESEATRLVFADLEAFTRRKADEFCSVFEQIAELRSKLANSPVILLGDRAELSIKQYDTELVVDDVAIDTHTIRAYYASFMKDSDLRRKLLSAGRPRLIWLDVDQDRVMFALWSQFACIRPARTGGGLEAQIFEDGSRNGPSYSQTDAAKEPFEQAALQWAKE